VVEHDPVIFFVGELVLAEARVEADEALIDPGEPFLVGIAKRSAVEREAAVDDPDDALLLRREPARFAGVVNCLDAREQFRILDDLRRKKRRGRAPFPSRSPASPCRSSWR
jgi:hypothetical protein